MCASQDRIFAAGEFGPPTAFTPRNVAQWTGEYWTFVNHGVWGAILVEGGSAASATIYRDQLIVGGQFREGRDTQLNNVAVSPPPIGGTEFFDMNGGLESVRARCSPPHIVNC
jgi:hypothetical protein